MKNLNELDVYRDVSQNTINLFGNIGNHENGLFWVPSCMDTVLLKIIASSDMGWDHVSISRNKRCPNWPEIEQVKHLFFKDNETAMQLHVPKSEHINIHPYCLHIWRPLDTDIPKPPSILVGY